MPLSEKIYYLYVLSDIASLQEFDLMRRSNLTGKSFNAKPVFETAALALRNQNLS